MKRPKDEKATRIGLLAGEGELPCIFADHARAQGVTIVAFAARGFAAKELESCVDKIYWLDFSEIGKLPLLFFLNRVRSLVMLGEIPKTVFFKRNFGRNRIISSLMRVRGPDTFSDDSLLRNVALRLERIGMKFLDPSLYLHDLLPAEGVFTERQPTQDEWEDIEFGKRMGREIGRLDIGQTIVVKNKAVIAVEAIEGTDEAIRRAGKLSPETVIVKLIKPNQDTRFDIPTIGEDTVNAMIEAHARVLAVEAGKTFFVNRDKALKKAHAHGLSIVAIA